ncbi:Ribonuclease P protein component [Catellicoccus marimammalium M35/04/3]|uniref:Ribonuclease P protein component n=2 Tax=Catellicoccus TaxID=300418 RepID=K8Z8H9_9ENTE|nr:Ribonuclease P protein component [Catellicoccus marimammalium M35/04/3]
MKEMIMKKTYRIKKEQDFQEIINARASFANRHLVLFIRDRKDGNHFRVGLSVGKKIGNAVMRNRVKRQLRVAVQELKPNLMQGMDLILIARPRITQLSTKEVIKNVRHVCSLAGVIIEEDDK